MSITFNATAYNAITATSATSHNASAILLNDTAIVTGQAGTITLNCNNGGVGGTLLALTTPGGTGGILRTNLALAANVTFTTTENNANVITNANTLLLANKTISSASNTLDANYINDIQATFTSQPNTFISYNSTLNQWVNTPYSPGSTSYPYWTFTDTRATGTGGGNGPNGFVNRTINLLAAQSSANGAVTNPSTTTISFNTVGAYYIDAFSTVRGAAAGTNAQLFLTNPAGTTTFITGLTSRAGPQNQALMLLGVLKVTTVPLVVALRCFLATGGANNLGAADNIAGVSEVYTVMHIRLIGT